MQARNGKPAAGSPVGLAGGQDGGAGGSLADTPQNRERAHRLLDAGRLDEARALYEALARAAPADADLVGRLAKVALMQGRGAEAEPLLRRALGLGGGPLIRLRTLYDLGALLRGSGREAEALELVAAEAPEWPAPAPAAGAWRDIVLWFVDTLLAAGATAKARRLLERALPDRSADANALALEGRLSLMERNADGAIRVVQALGRLGEDQAATAMVRHICRIWSGFADPAQPSQRATILLCNPAPTSAGTLPTSLRDLHFRGNYAGQAAQTLHEEYRFVSVFAELLETNFHEQLPKCDLVLNNSVNAEQLAADGLVDSLRRQIDATGLPVINHPDRAVQTTRENTPRLLAGIPNLKLPGIARYRTALAPLDDILSDIGRRLAYPLIVRQPLAQSSTSSLLAEDEKKTALLVPDPAALRAHLERNGWSDFYVIEYVDLKREDGFYRKLRAVIIDREIIVTQAAAYREWMVTGWRSRPEGIAFYRANPQIIAECNAIVLDPEAHLGAAAMQTLQAIGQRIPLDMFGIDFEVDREGRVVFFEATAAMTFKPRRHGLAPDLRQPAAPSHRVDAAFRDLVARRLAGDPGPAA